MATKLFCDRCGVELINNVPFYDENHRLGVHFVGIREADLCDICKEDLQVFMANNQIAQTVWVLTNANCIHPIGVFDSKEKAENIKNELEANWSDSTGAEVVYIISAHVVR